MKICRLFLKICHSRVASRHICPTSNTRLVWNERFLRPRNSNFSKLKINRALISKAFSIFCIMSLRGTGWPKTGTLRSTTANLNTVLVLFTTPVWAFSRLQDGVNSRRDESCMLLKIDFNRDTTIILAVLKRCC